MSLFLNRLETLRNHEMVVVMRDNRSFRGTLVDFDADTLLLRNVVEGLPNNAAGWEEPTASTGIVHKVVTWKGTFSHDDTRAEVVKLKDVMIRVHHIVRIWEWSTKNVERPDHFEKADIDEHTPGSTVRRSA